MLFVIPFEFLSGNKQPAISKGMQQIQETSLYFLFLTFPLAVHVPCYFAEISPIGGKVHCVITFLEFPWLIQIPGFSLTL